MARIIDGKDLNIVGSRVRELRLKRNLSQQALSDKLETLAIYICRGSIHWIEVYIFCCPITTNRLLNFTIS